VYKKDVKVEGPLHRKIINKVFKFPFGPLKPKNCYQEITRKNRAIIVRLKNIFSTLKIEEIEEDDLLSGEINVDVLHEAAASRYRKRDVFKEYEQHKIPKMLFLVDLSGSMDGRVGASSTRIQLVREMCIIVSEALKDFTDFGIMGFTAKQRMDEVAHFWFKEFGKPVNVKALESIDTPMTYSENRDGYSIRYAAEVAKNNGAEILVVISDGAPFHGGTSYVSERAREDTRKAIIEARRKGLRVCGIIFEEEKERWMENIYGPSFFVCPTVDSFRKGLLRLVKSMFMEVL